MEFSDQQRLFLAAVCKHFHETGTWPTYGMIDKVLRPHKSLDVEEIGKELDSFMHDSIHAPLVGWDPKHAITMNVSALYRCQKEDICPKLSQDLEAFALLVRICIAQYEADKEEMPITSDEFLDGASLIPFEVLGNVFQLIEVEGFYSSIGFDEDTSRGSPTRWNFKMSNSIRKYRDVKTIEDYLAVRKKLQTANWSSLKVVPRDSATPITNLDMPSVSTSPLPTAVAIQIQDKPKIFVSHSSKDAVFASKLVEHLKAAGADAWMDVNDLGAGNFQQGISKALDECEWFVLVFTQHALDSQWVRQEVDAANRLKNQGQIHNLIFIKADADKHSKVPSLWGVYNILDGVADYGMALIRILKAVGLLSAT